MRCITYVWSVPCVPASHLLLQKCAECSQDGASYLGGIPQHIKLLGVA